MDPVDLVVEAAAHSDSVVAVGDSVERGLAVTEVAAYVALEIEIVAFVERPLAAAAVVAGALFGLVVLELVVELMREPGPAASAGGVAVVHSVALVESAA